MKESLFDELVSVSTTKICQLLQQQKVSPCSRTTGTGSTSIALTHSDGGYGERAGSNQSLVGAEKRSGNGVAEHCDRRSSKIEIEIEIVDVLRRDDQLQSWSVGVKTGWLRWMDPDGMTFTSLRLIAPTNGGLRHSQRHQVIVCLHCLSGYPATLVT